MAVPYTFANATVSIPLSQLDSNFATAITLGNTAIELGNTVTTLNNMTLANVTVSSGNATFTTANVTNMSSGNVTITGGTIANVTISGSGSNITATNINASNVTVSTDLTLSGGTANGVAYLNGSKVLTTGSALTFDGTNLVVASGDANINGLTVGRGGGSVNTNTANGANALRNNTTGYYNTANGANALYSNTTGVSNTANGYAALYSNTTGYINTANGVNALYSNTTGYYNTANGVNALYSNTTGYYNTANGVNALYSNTTGYNNTANGVNALYYNTTGSGNIANGYQALYNNTTGSGNTAINPLNSAGSYAPVFNPTTENNRFCMGSTGVTNAYIQVAWTVVSDARDKTDFATVPHGLDFVTKLSPTAYRYKMSRDSVEGHGPVRYGFKAQDVLALEGDNPVIVDAEDADKLRFNDQSMLAVLVNAIKELNAKIEAQAAEIKLLKGA